MIYGYLDLQIAVPSLLAAALALASIFLVKLKYEAQPRIVAYQVLILAYSLLGGVTFLILQWSELGAAMFFFISVLRGV